MRTKLITVLLSATLFAGGISGSMPGMATAPVRTGEEPAVETETTDTASVPGSFSIAWITDSQGCSSHKGEYRTIAEWISEHREEFNIRYVVGTGDYVWKGTRLPEWEEFHSFVEGIGTVPSFFIAGNHDLERLKGDNPGTFLQMDVKTAEIPDDQKHRGGFGKYALFSEGGMDFVLAGLSYGFGDEDIEWMRDVLSRYPDRKGILLFHHFLTPSNRVNTEGKKLLDAIRKGPGNARLVLSGHNHGRGTGTFDVTEDGSHYLRAILYNYQDSALKKGTVRILTFHPESGQVIMTAYYPLKPHLEPFQIVYEMDFS